MDNTNIKRKTETQSLKSWYYPLACYFHCESLRSSHHQQDPAVISSTKKADCWTQSNEEFALEENASLRHSWRALSNGSTARPI